MSETLYYGTKRIADRLGVGKRMVFKWIRVEKMPVFRDSDRGAYMILESSLSHWLKDFERKFLVNS